MTLVECECGFPNREVSVESTVNVCFVRLRPDEAAMRIVALNYICICLIQCKQLHNCLIIVSNADECCLRVLKP